MGFWRTVNEELKKAVEDGVAAVKDGVEVSRLRYKMLTLQKEADRRFSEIGGIVYDMAKPPWENPLSKPEVLKLAEEIKGVEDEIRLLEEEIRKIKRKEPSAPSHE